MQVTKQQERQIIIKGIEVARFEALLESIPHVGAKKIINFINECQTARQLEINRAEAQAKLITELNELKTFKKTVEDNQKAVKEAVPKLTSQQPTETATGINDMNTIE